jgi:hypothetical protein
MPEDNPYMLGSLQWPEDVAAKDATIAEQAERIATLEGEVTLHKEIADAREFDYHSAEKRISDLEAALGEAGEALEPFAKTAKQLDEAGPYAQIADDDDVLCGGFKLSLPMRYLRKAKDVREKIKALCHASPEQADGSVSPDKPALHPGDGETR